MSSNVPTYIPAPNWDIPADSDIVVLGRLIQDPKDPQSKVPDSRDIPITPPKIYPGEKTDWATTLERLRSGRIGLWAKCLQFIQGQLSFSKLKSALEEHKFEVLETKYFLPDKVYLTQALEDVGVQAYFEALEWQEPVYLITGIKYARGASVSTESNTESSATAALKADGSSAGVPAEAGPEASWESKKKRGISYGGSSDYIFAYQLTKIKPKDEGQDFSSKAYVKGAVYGRDGDAEDDEVQVEDRFDIAEETELGYPDTWEQIKED